MSQAPAPTPDRSQPQNPSTSPKSPSSEAGMLRLPHRWRVGEHMAIVGDTGSGKSTLAAELLTLRRYALIFRSKADKVRYSTDRRVSKANPAMRDPRLHRIELQPAYDEQYEEFAEALDNVWEQHGWTVYLDELLYLDRLGLRPEIERLLTQGRSLGITVAVGMQRPSQVSRFAISESKHVLAFSLEGRDAKLLAEATTRQLADVVAGLRRHHFAWFYRPDKSIWTGRLQDLLT